MTSAVTGRFLHVTNGTSTTGTMAAAGIPGARSIWADPLYEGPVPAGLSDLDLMEGRRQFLGDSSDPANDLRQWRAAIAGHESYDELVLWFEHDLFDQLNLIQLLSWIRDHVPDRTPVSLICIGSFPGHPGFKGLGELTTGELASLLATRRPVEAPQYALAQRAWQAFREPTPAALDDLRQRDTSPLPYLGDAITRFLQEYPWTSDGLSRSERRLLELAGRNGIALSNAFPRMYDEERAYHVTDRSLAALAEMLAHTSPPLLTLDLATPGNGRVLRGRVALTDAGQSVLSGEQDRVAICGIDRWLGGVHLESGGRIWRWDDAQQGVI